MTFHKVNYRIKRIFPGVYVCITWTNSLTEGLLCKLVSDLQMAVTEKHFKDNLWYVDTFHDTQMDKTKLNQ